MSKIFSLDSSDRYYKKRNSTRIVMKTILWYQPEKIGAPDIVAADGVILAKTKRDFAFSK